MKEPNYEILMRHLLTAVVSLDFNVNRIKIFIYNVSGSMNYIKPQIYAFNKLETIHYY